MNRERRRRLGPFVARRGAQRRPLDLRRDERTGRDQLVAPALIYDLVRHGRVHRAYLIGLGLFLPFVLATHFAWNSAGWQRLVAAMIGVDG